jgi:hypothetical protein
MVIKSPVGLGAWLWHRRRVAIAPRFQLLQGATQPFGAGDFDGTTVFAAKFYRRWTPMFL